MLGVLVVGQIGLVAQRMLQTRPVVHRDRAELHFDRRVMRAARQEHRHRIDHMQRAVAVLLGVAYVILHAQHLNVRLRREVIRHRIHVVPVIADHAYASDVEQVVTNRLHRIGKATSVEFAQNRFG